MTETNFFATATTNASDAEIPEYSEERQTLYTRNLVKNEP